MRSLVAGLVLLTACVESPTAPPPAPTDCADAMASEAAAYGPPAQIDRGYTTDGGEWAKWVYPAWWTNPEVPGVRMYTMVVFTWGGPRRACQVSSL